MQKKVMINCEGKKFKRLYMFQLIIFHRKSDSSFYISTEVLRYLFTFALDKISLATCFLKIFLLTCTNEVKSYKLRESFTIQFICY